MTRVYIVEHTYITHQGTEETKMIGVYSSELEAHRAVKRLRTKPGFAQYPDGFAVGPMVLDQDYWGDGFFDPDKDES